MAAFVAFRRLLSFSLRLYVNSHPLKISFYLRAIRSHFPRVRPGRPRPNKGPSSPTTLTMFRWHKFSVLITVTASRSPLSAPCPSSVMRPKRFWTKSTRQMDFHTARRRGSEYIYRRTAREQACGASVHTGHGHDQRSCGRR
jgi:hypothetical protein